MTQLKYVYCEGVNVAAKVRQAAEFADARGIAELVCLQRIGCEEFDVKNLVAACKSAQVGLQVRVRPGVETHLVDGDGNILLPGFMRGIERLVISGERIPFRGRAYEGEQFLDLVGYRGEYVIEALHSLFRGLECAVQRYPGAILRSPMQGLRALGYSESNLPIQAMIRLARIAEANRSSVVSTRDRLRSSSAGRAPARSGTISIHATPESVTMIPREARG